MAKNGKKIIKVIGVLGALVVVGIVLLVVVALGSINTIAKTAIQKGGSYATGVQTSVESVDISLLGGTFQMTEFDIGNPEGFKSPHFFGMGNTNVALEIGSLSQDTIRLPELTLASIEVHLEGSGDKANYNIILNNLKRFEASGDSESKKKKADKDKTGSSKTFVVDVITIDGVTVHVSGIPGVAQAIGDVTIDVPKIELRDVGKSGALTMAELVNVIIKTVLSATIEAGGGIIPTDVLKDLGGQLAQLDSLGEMGITAVGDVGNIAGQFGPEATKALEDSSGALDDAAKSIGEGLDNLFGGGDKEKK